MVGRCEYCYTGYTAKPPVPVIIGFDDALNEVVTDVRIVCGRCRKKLGMHEVDVPADSEIETDRPEVVT